MASPGTTTGSGRGPSRPPQGRSVGSVFSRLAGEGLSTAMFATKKKFSPYQRSWPGMDRAVIDLDSTRMVQTLTADLETTQRAFTFVHLSNADIAGHRYGWLSPAYLAAVRQTDADRPKSSRPSRRRPSPVTTPSSW